MIAPTRLSGLLVLCLAPVRVGAQASTPAADTTPKITFGAFIDGYYAWDFDRPYNFDRAYTTQPARHAEFNINLAYVEAKLTAPNFRGRLAVQFGTSVQDLYAAEPHIGEVSGPSVAEFIQEATAGYKLSSTLWIDGGIFAAHTGYEGWISRDNLTYTRSLMADYSAYYEAGVKLTWSPSQAVAAQFLVLNGWQDISNYNTPPALGARVDYTVSPVLTLSYDNFVGVVSPDTVIPQVRFFNEWIAQYNPTARWQLAAAVDLGLQSRTASAHGTATWDGAALIAKYHPTAKVGVVGRIERYADPSRAIVQTNLPVTFEASGASLGVDVSPVSRLLWRTEARALRADRPVFPLHHAGGYSRNDGFVVTSLALTI
ncbi:MAG TPA: outer membrane beta-barrel protein [Gemmatimonadaceae bacterium]|jgi:hypothetical protein|nr:outer membrane beta-barrel protein [Gemmatimonadaceae bacterium]